MLFFHSWGLNWGFAYELPTNISYFKNVDIAIAKEKRSIETKPMIKRRQRRDLYNKLEALINKWVPYYCFHSLQYHSHFLVWDIQAASVFCEHYVRHQNLLAKKAHISLLNSSGPLLLSLNQKFYHLNIQNT